MPSCGGELLLLLLLLWCVKVSQLRSLWGRNREDRDPANTGGSKNKHWKHGHGQNPARAGAELPRGHLWDCADPWGHRMEPDITTAVDKCRQCGRGQPGKYPEWRDEGINFKVKQRGGLFERPITANVWPFMPSLKGLPQSLWRTGTWMEWTREGKRWSNPGWPRHVQLHSDLHRSCIQEFL